MIMVGKMEMVVQILVQFNPFINAKELLILENLQFAKKFTNAEMKNLNLGMVNNAIMEM